MCSKFVHAMYPECTLRAVIRKAKTRLCLCIELELQRTAAETLSFWIGVVMADSSRNCRLTLLSSWMSLKSRKLGMLAHISGNRDYCDNYNDSIVLGRDFNSSPRNIFC